MSLTDNHVERDFELRDLLAVLRRRRWLALGVPLGCIVLGALVTARMPRIYRATAKVIIDESAPEVLSEVKDVYTMGGTGYWAGPEYMQTQFEVMHSRPVAQKVAAMLGLVPQELARELKAAGDASIESRMAGDAL